MNANEIVEVSAARNLHIVLTRMFFDRVHADVFDVCAGVCIRLGQSVSKAHNGRPASAANWAEAEAKARASFAEVDDSVSVEVDLDV